MTKIVLHLWVLFFGGPMSLAFSCLIDIAIQQRKVHYYRKVSPN